MHKFEKGSCLIYRKLHHNKTKGCSISFQEWGHAADVEFGCSHQNKNKNLQVQARNYRRDSVLSDFIQV